MEEAKQLEERIKRMMEMIKAAKKAAEEVKGGSERKKEKK
jgi:hypothetical protein